MQIAQSIHRWDMRFKLGILQDHAAIEKQIARDAAEHQAKKHKLEAPTVKTEAQTKADDAAAAKEKEKGVEKAKRAPALKPRIRPLSEAKAIDAGANFVSESFLLLIGVGLILFENWRRGEKESSRREDINDKIRELEGSEKSARKALVELEKEILRLRGENVKSLLPKSRILPKEVWELEETEEKAEEKQPSRWTSWIRSLVRKDSPGEPIDTTGRPDRDQNTTAKLGTADQPTDDDKTTTGVSGPKRLAWPFNSTAEPNESPKQFGIQAKPPPEQQESTQPIKKIP